ncbi:hypothetical protein STIV2_B60 [Sulfolobus turreted icosahedral virus 2]|uniref:Ribbon-helix-helix protein CopG domain-containing protein n=1 Tax=Sulfolobus turreted icosahedral virus 2 TaxID=754004 RepID=D5IEY0_9VIRU|nr:hypothetical protein STIV2_B60 [Sulfolobus turreted icosahedral virus 2]ADF27753.1 hypothetical protein STIV2_B60 [Sulfolobus turreted icosahedral virus 2]
MTMQVITFKIEQDLLELLDKYALKHGLNRSEAIRRCIETVVRNEIKQETVPVAKVEKIRL